MADPEPIIKISPTITMGWKTLGIIIAGAFLAGFALGIIFF